MNAKIYRNLKSAFDNVKTVIATLQERDSKRRCGTHEKEIDVLADALEHLRVIDGEFSNPN